MIQPYAAGSLESGRGGHVAALEPSDAAFQAIATLVRMFVVTGLGQRRCRH